MSTTVIQAQATSLNRHAVTYASEMKQELRQSSEFERMLTPRACDHTYSAPNVSISEIVQQYQWKFTPKSSATFDAVDNTLQKIKIDVNFTADDLEKFWDSWKVEWHELGKDPMEWSFHRYLYDVVITPKIIEEMNRNAWAGEYVAPTDGVAGVSINSVDGYRKKIADAITAGKVVPITTGALVDSTMVNQTETFTDSIPQPYRDLPGVIKMSKTHARNYYRDYRANFGTGNGVINPNDELRIDATQKRIEGVAAMEGSDRMIFVPTNSRNMIWGTRKGYSSFPMIRWEKFERSIKGLAEFYRFYGFEYWNNLFVNDQV